MQLLLVRHAIAEDRAEFARRSPDDAARPLTAEGRKKMERIAVALGGLVPEMEALASSPLVRAVQTAEILAAAYEGAKPVQIDELAPGRDPGRLLRWVRGRKASGVVALVGHEPDLSLFASWLLTRQRQPILALRKGGACLIEFPNGLAPGGAVLAWLLTPAQLRSLRG